MLDKRSKANNTIASKVKMWIRYNSNRSKEKHIMESDVKMQKLSTSETLEQQNLLWRLSENMNFEYQRTALTG